MSVNPELLFQKINSLPPGRLEEVDDFVEFIKNREAQQRAAASQRLGEVMARLDALNLPPLSIEEVQSEIKSARAERRAVVHADRC